MVAARIPSDDVNTFDPLSNQGGSPHENNIVNFPSPHEQLVNKLNQNGLNEYLGLDPNAPALMDSNGNLLNLEFGSSDETGRHDQYFDPKTNTHFSVVEDRGNEIVLEGDDGLQQTIHRIDAKDNYINTLISRLPNELATRFKSEYADFIQKNPDKDEAFYERGYYQILDGITSSAKIEDIEAMRLKDEVNAITDKLNNLATDIGNPRVLALAHQRYLNDIDFPIEKLPELDRLARSKYGRSLGEMYGRSEKDLIKEMAIEFMSGKTKGVVSIKMPPVPEPTEDNPKVEERKPRKARETNLPVPSDPRYQEINNLSAEQRFELAKRLGMDLVEGDEVSSREVWELSRKLNSNDYESTVNQAATEAQLNADTEAMNEAGEFVLDRNKFSGNRIEPNEVIGSEQTIEVEPEATVSEPEVENRTGIQFQINRFRDGLVNEIGSENETKFLEFLKSNGFPTWADFYTKGKNREQAILDEYRKQNPTDGLLPEVKIELRPGEYDEAMVQVDASAREAENAFANNANLESLNDDEIRDLVNEINRVEGRVESPLTYNQIVSRYRPEYISQVYSGIRRVADTPVPPAPPTPPIPPIIDSKEFDDAGDSKLEKQKRELQIAKENQAIKDRMNPIFSELNVTGRRRNALARYLADNGVTRANILTEPIETINALARDFVISEARIEAERENARRNEIFAENRFPPANNAEIARATNEPVEAVENVTSPQAEVSPIFSPRPEEKGERIATTAELDALPTVPPEEIATLHQTLGNAEVRNMGDDEFNEAIARLSGGRRPVELSREQFEGYIEQLNQMNPVPVQNTSQQLPPLVERLEEATGNEKERFEIDSRIFNNNTNYDRVLSGFVNRFPDLAREFLEIKDIDGTSSSVDLTDEQKSIVTKVFDKYRNKLINKYRVEHGLDPNQDELERITRSALMRSMFDAVVNPGIRSLGEEDQVRIRTRQPGETNTNITQKLNDYFSSNRQQKAATSKPNLVNRIRSAIPIIGRRNRPAA